MTVVSSKDFAVNQDKYFDLAEQEQIFIQRGDCMFIVQNIDKNIEPDGDFYRSIPMEDVRDKVIANIRKKYAHTL